MPCLSTGSDPQLLLHSTPRSEPAVTPTVFRVCVTPAHPRHPLHHPLHVCMSHGIRCACRMVCHTRHAEETHHSTRLCCTGACFLCVRCSMPWVGSVCVSVHIPVRFLGVYGTWLTAGHASSFLLSFMYSFPLSLPPPPLPSFLSFVRQCLTLLPMLSAVAGS